MVESQNQRGFIYAINADHLEAIRQIEEEIEWAQACIDQSEISDPENSIPLQVRILHRLEAWRDEMKRGMKPTATQKEQP